MIIQCRKQSDYDFTLINQKGQVVQYIASPVLQSLGEAPFHFRTISQVDAAHFRDSEHLYRLHNHQIDYLNPVQHSFYSNGHEQVECTPDGALKFYNNYELKIEIPPFLPLPRLDGAVITKYIVCYLHSAIFYLDLKTKDIIHIIQLDHEIHSIFPLNEFGHIAAHLILFDRLHICTFDNAQPVKSLDLLVKEALSFTLSVSYTPYCLTAISSPLMLTFLLVPNSYSSDRLFQRQLPISGCKQISKFNDLLLILLTSGELKFFRVSDANNLSPQEYLDHLEMKTIYSTSKLDQLVSGPDYIYNFSNQTVQVLKLLQPGQECFVLKGENKFNFKSLQIQHDKIIGVTATDILLFSLTNNLLRRYSYTIPFSNLKYCPHYEALLFWETKVQYCDQLPTDNLSLQVQQIENTFLQMVDFHTNSYNQPNQQNSQQSYLIQSKISCGFIISYIVTDVTNIHSNIFALSTESQIKIVSISNQPYQLTLLFQFGVLNQALINFKNSLPLEDLERIPFLREQAPEQRILFADFWSTQGIIQTVYSIKWASLNLETNQVCLVDLKYQGDVRLQQVLYVDNETQFAYLLSNNEELYLASETQLKRLYVCDCSLGSALVLNNQTYIFKSNGQVLITELHNPTNILSRMML